MSARYQDLSRFRVPPNFRGRSGLVVLLTYANQPYGHRFSLSDISNWGASMYNYIAIVHKNPDSDYGASFPGSSWLRNRRLNHRGTPPPSGRGPRLHLEGMLEDGAKLPQSTTPEVIAAREENDRAVAIFEVKVAILKQSGNR